MQFLADDRQPFADDPLADDPSSSTSESAASVADAGLETGPRLTDSLYLSYRDNSKILSSEVSANHFKEPSTPASAAKSRKSESRGSSAKKQKTMPSSVVPHRVFQNQTLNEMGGSHAFLCLISGMITPECVSRIGDHWYAATKRSALGSILRASAWHSEGTKHRRLRRNLR